MNRDRLGNAPPPMTSFRQSIDLRQRVRFAWDLWNPSPANAVQFVGVQPGSGPEFVSARSGSV